MKNYYKQIVISELLYQPTSKIVEEEIYGIPFKTINLTAYLLRSS